MAYASTFSMPLVFSALLLRSSVSRLGCLSLLWTLANTDSGFCLSFLLSGVHDLGTLETNSKQSSFADSRLFFVSRLPPVACSVLALR